MSSSRTSRFNADMFFQTNSEFEQSQKLPLSLSNKEVLPFFINTRYLNRIELGFQKKRGETPIPFFWTMSYLSPFYSYVFKKVDELKIPRQLTPYNSMRLVTGFNPFSRVLNIPQFVKDELSWCVQQPISNQLFSYYLCVFAYNFGVHHEALHLIFYKLIPPPKKKDLSEYLYFIEAMVMAYEVVVAFDLGPYVSKTLKGLGVIYSGYGKADSETRKKNPKDAFMANFVAYMGILNQWPMTKIKKEFPQYKAFIKAKRESYFADNFVEQTTPQWIQNSKYKKFISSSSLHGHKPLKLDDFSVASLTPEVLDKIWNWISQHFYAPI